MKKSSTITGEMVAKVVKKNSILETAESKLWMAVLVLAIEEMDLKKYKRQSVAFFSCRWFQDVCDLAGVVREYVSDMVKMIGNPIPQSCQRDPNAK